HTGAQGRAKGFTSVVKQYPGIEVLDTQPADWDVSKAARLWETYLTKYPQIDAAFFHNDDMALAAYNIMKARNRTNILIGGVDALRGVDFALFAGEIHGLVGENGAGKSTLMKIIAGVYPEFSGRFVLDGKETRFRSTRDAHAAGIAMVHQELSVAPDLTVA